MTQVLYKTYKKYSGLQINGTTSVKLPTKYKFNHMWRAFYLTAQLEAPKWGSVQSYDGAGISGGPFHYTAYSPGSGKQGSLFSLLRSVEVGLGTQRNKNLEALWKLFKKYGWFVARDGKLRDINEGYEIKGIDILKEFAPPNGAVPKEGGYYARAEEVALAFYNLLSDPATFHAQTEHAIAYLVQGQKALEMQAYSTLMGYQDKDVINSTETITISEDASKYGPYLKYDEDLAMCVYHSHSVNAPGPARNCLKSVLEKDTNNISGDLIYLLGTSNYGRWHDTKDGKNRYDRTRQAAIKSNLWPESLFADGGIMPENIKE